jgi:hypothetical protein
MRVGFDVDGVLYNWHASLRQFLGFDLDRAPDPTAWHFHEQWGVTKEELGRAAMDGVDAGVVLTWGVPLPGAKETMDRIKALGHTIHIVTDRSAGEPGNAQAATIKWLHAHDLPYDTVTFARDKTIANVDMFIDDKLDNYDALQMAGTLVYLLDRPWNQQEDAWPFRRRIFSLEQYGDIIEHGFKGRQVQAEAEHQRLAERARRDDPYADLPEPSWDRVETTSRTGVHDR